MRLPRARGSPQTKKHRQRNIKVEKNVLLRGLVPYTPIKHRSMHRTALHASIICQARRVHVPPPPISQNINETQKTRVSGAGLCSCLVLFAPATSSVEPHQVRPELNHSVEHTKRGDGDGSVRRGRGYSWTRGRG